MVGGVCTPSLPERGKVGKRQHVLELEAVELRPLLLVFTEDADGLGVLRHVLRVLRRVVHVDRGADRPDQPEREVEEHPFEAGRGQDREGVALPHSEGEQAVGDLVHRLSRLRPGDRPPVLAVLDEVGRALEAAGDGVLPQTGDCPCPRSPGRDRHGSIVF